MKQEFILTILTPSYNRGELLKQLYKSLIKQTVSDFQWLIIDDGSTDETRNIVKKLKEEKIIQIDYYYKENGGKHTAINFSHNYIKGKYVVIVDSDDLLTNDAVETIVSYWNKYGDDEEISGIVFQRGDKKNGIKMDNRISGEYISTMANEINRGMKGDHCETVRTDRLKSFLFPVYPNENFIAEAAMWYSITKNYKVVYCDKVVYLCEYLQDGLTKSGRILHIKNARGCMWHASVFLNSDFNLKIKIKNAMLYACYAKFSGENRKSAISRIRKGKELVQMFWPAGYLVYKHWKRQYKINYVRN